MKISIPAQTVNIDVEAWATEYGIEVSKVREDVKAYFAGYCQEQVVCLGLEDEWK